MAERPAAAAARTMLSDELPTYLRTLVEQGRSAHTVTSTRLDLLQLARFLGRQTVGSVSADDLRAFFAWLGRQQGNRVSSVRRKTSTVKGLFRHLHAAGALRHDPAAELVYPPLVAASPVPLSPAEIDAIVAAAETPAWRVLVLCLADAGLKRDEAIALRTEDVELIDGPDGPGRLHVRHRQATRRVRQRTLRLSSRLAQALARHPAGVEHEQSGRVFDLSARGIDFIVETCGRRAGVLLQQKVTPRMLRDAFACARIRTFSAREAELGDDHAGQRDLRREHDALLLRELGLSDSSAVAERYRRLVGGLQVDGTEQR